METIPGGCYKKSFLKTISRVVTLLITAAVFFIPVFAASAEEARGTRLAMISFENMDDNNEHSYLSGLISAVIREDLSNTEGITLLDRSKYKQHYRRTETADLGTF